MGLDIALGVVVLLAAVRGWFKGFVLQAIPLAALAGCVFLADPLRDLARPFAREYFPGVQPELMDRLLWWTGAVVGFLLTSGIAVSTVKLYRKRHYLEGMEPNRGDQGAGFLLGGLKAAVVLAFVVAAVARHAPQYVRSGGWMAQQIQTSQAVRLSDRYHPADEVWNSVPVRSIVHRVRTRGLWGDPEAAPEAGRTETAQPSPPEARRELPVAVASPLPKLSIPRPAPLDPRSPRFMEELDRALAEEVRRTR